MKWRFQLYSQYKVFIYLDGIVISLHILTESVYCSFYRKSLLYRFNISNYITYILPNLISSTPFLSIFLKKICKGKLINLDLNVLLNIKDADSALNIK